MTRQLRRLWVRWRRARKIEPTASRPARPEVDPADLGTTLGLEISVPSRPTRAPASRSARRPARS